ncbi:hypothetical protein NsoK4_06760 [Nitrosopumilus sp. K4]|uniref:hypothetical protein n=1 Tax=Nitrosopumilus sp. K4 TaxID=2795383 RepID=UPI001BACF918|nr:hypothetical protein [Nitrosopumilus sp. K4]QUC64141.1 hypothetical protein NsoK4_06760 [Nitrosopumilus sp. K4]
MDETESDSSEKISVCDIMKSNTSQIIKKMESQVPSRIQEYSDLYSAYLHTLDTMFSSCYLSEKKFFEGLDIDQNALKLFQQTSQVFSKSVIEQLDMYAKYRQELTKMQVSGIKTYDKFLLSMMESYTQYLDQFNKLVSQNKK